MPFLGQKVHGYTSNKNDTFEDMERKRKKWYIRVNREERVPDMQFTNSRELGRALSEHEKISKKVNELYSLACHLKNTEIFLKKATWKDYDELEEKYIRLNNSPKEETYTEELINDDIIIGYLSDRLDMADVVYIRSKLKEAGDKEW